MKFSVRQCNATYWVTLLTGVFAINLIDKEPNGLYLSVGLVVLAATVALFVRFNTPDPLVEEEEREPLERESPYYLTVGELISILEDSVDDSVVVLDGHGNPISNVTKAPDADFENGVWLSGFAVNRNLFQLETLTNKKAQLSPPEAPSED